MPENDISEKLWSWEDLENTVRAHYKDPDLALLRRAYDFAAEAHGDIKRYSGTPYIVHPIATAVRLAEMELPMSIVIAGLLHDVPEDTERTIEKVRDEFGNDVADMVAGVTKLSKIKYRGIERYAENLRKMFLAMAADVRVVFIKFADRLHNLETLAARPEQKRIRTALEVIEIYSPIASRLGMGEMKGQLEDAAFKFAYPDDYQKALAIYNNQIQAREDDLKITIREAAEIVKALGIQLISVSGRRKFLYSFWQKLQRYHGDVSKIYDIIAVRIVVRTVADCYAALGQIHAHWTPLRGRIKDYISQPKPNGYQSLHTTVFDEHCGIVEFQIRTKEMHELAEFGIAAHWHYKEGDSNRPVSVMPWMKDLVEIHKEISTGSDFMKKLDEVKLDMFRDRIFVFTPEGDVMDLPEGSTAIDFAYAIHTEVGDKCVSANVNDQAVSLDTPLKSGDMCQIITDKKRKGPNPEWLTFVRTSHAKEKIKQATKSVLKRWIDAVTRK
ncbi:MAG: RelA/SpoT family protein [Patescibacteria group bacterium]